jgi:MFS family permease
MIVIGTALLAVSCATWGCLEYVENKTVFVTVFILWRIIMGFGISASQTSSYAVLTLLYPEEISKAVGVIEGSIGIGLAIGPGFGSLLYYFFNFKGPFYGLSIVYFVGILFIKPMISDEVETDPSEAFHISKSNVCEPPSDAAPISYKKLIKNRRIVFACLSAFTNIWQFTLIEPFFADYLFERYSLSPEICGVIFLSIGFGYAISCQVVSCIVPYFALRRLMISGLIWIGIFTSFYGPSDIIGVEGKVWMSSAALFCAGLTSALSLLPVIPEMIDESKRDDDISPHLDKQVNIDVLNDHVSGLYNFFFALGNVIGPLLGNWMYVSYGGPVTFDLMALYIVMFALLYFFWCDDLFHKRPDPNEGNFLLEVDMSHFSYEKDLVH